MNRRYLLFVVLTMAGSVFAAAEGQPFVYLDLDEAANMGFYDPVAGDGKGGWADFGPEACFHEIPYGVHTFQDSVIPFRILDPEDNDGKSVITLSGPGRESVLSLIHI